MEEALMTSISRTSIETVSGRWVSMAKPEAETISIDDVAWGLARQPRFVGQTMSQRPYSVAQHSVMVCEITADAGHKAEPGILLHALLHDAHEAYIGDVPAPVSMLPDMRGPLDRLKHRLQKACVQACVPTGFRKLDDMGKTAIAVADQKAFEFEQFHLMRGRGLAWRNTHTRNALLHEDELVGSLEALDQEACYSQFMSTYELLMAECKGVLRHRRKGV